MRRANTSTKPTTRPWIEKATKAEVIEQYKRLGDTVTDLDKMVKDLRRQLSEKDASLEHIRARTELIKSMSWAMKACSSVMWSEKTVGWDHAKWNQLLMEKGKV